MMRVSRWLAWVGMPFRVGESRPRRVAGPDGSSRRGRLAGRAPLAAEGGGAGRKLPARAACGAGTPGGRGRRCHEAASGGDACGLRGGRVRRPRAAVSGGGVGGPRGGPGGDARGLRGGRVRRPRAAMPAACGAVVPGGDACGLRCGRVRRPRAAMPAACGAVVPGGGVGQRCRRPCAGLMSNRDARDTSIPCGCDHPGRHGRADISATPLAGGFSGCQARRRSSGGASAAAETARGNRSRLTHRLRGVLGPPSQRMRPLADARRRFANAGADEVTDTAIGSDRWTGKDTQPSAATGSDRRPRPAAPRCARDNRASCASVRPRRPSPTPSAKGRMTRKSVIAVPRTTPEAAGDAVRVAIPSR